MEKVADNKGIALDRAAAGNASGHTNHAPSSWGDIIKNNVGKMPAAPRELHVPAADAVEKQINDKGTGQTAAEHYDATGGGRAKVVPNFERAMGKEGGVFVDGLGDLLPTNVQGGIKDLGGVVREHILPPIDKK
jgi:hypothetical protein